MATSLIIVWIITVSVWTCVHAGCNQKLAAKRDEVTYLTSPGYPANFSQYVDCYYEIYTTSDDVGLVIYVDVVDITLQCDDDNTQLHVYDEFSRHPRLLGRVCEGGQRTFQSPRHSLYFSFRSRTQHGGRSRGFRLRVRTEPKYCHCYTQDTAVLDVTPTPATLTTPYYPFATEGNVNCHWLLKADDDTRVNVTLLDADMKGSNDCRRFGLRVYDGKTTYDDTLLASVCDNSLQTFLSSGPYLLLVFFSGPVVFRGGGGVKLQYSTTPATGNKDYHINQTLFFLITSLLILLILIIMIIAVIKLYFLPRRRKQAERRRRAARARLTRISRQSNDQSESASHSESRRHASCSRAPSTISGSSMSSQSSAMSLTRLLSLYGLKKCRQHHRCSARGAHSPDCLYGSQSQGQRSGVMIRVPDFFMEDNYGFLAGDLPPSYEEAIGQMLNDSGVTDHEVRGQGVIRQMLSEGEVMGERARIQDVVGRILRGSEGASRSEAMQEGDLGQLMRENEGTTSPGVTQEVLAQLLTESEVTHLAVGGPEVVQDGVIGQGVRSQEVTGEVLSESEITGHQDVTVQGQEFTGQSQEVTGQILRESDVTHQGQEVTGQDQEFTGQILQESGVTGQGTRGEDASGRTQHKNKSDRDPETTQEEVMEPGTRDQSLGQTSIDEEVTTQADRDQGVIARVVRDQDVIGQTLIEDGVKNQGTRVKEVIGQPVNEVEVTEARGQEILSEKTGKDARCMNRELEKCDTQKIGEKGDAQEISIEQVSAQEDINTQETVENELSNQQHLQQEVAQDAQERVRGGNLKGQDLKQ